MPYSSPWDYTLVRQVLTTESRQKARELFLRTHRPFRHVRVDFCKEQDLAGRFVGEEEIYALIGGGPLEADNRIFLVVGEAGAGKSELCQWLEYRTDPARRLAIHVPRSMTSAAHVAALLRRALGIAGALVLRRTPVATQARHVVLSAAHLRVPLDVIAAKCARFYRANKVVHRAELLAESDYSIVTRFREEYRGIVQYYLPAHNVRYLSRLRWVMEQALLKTLAAKHKTSVHAIWQRVATTVTTPEGRTMRCFEVRVERENKPPLEARYGGISLKRQPEARLDDQPYVYKVSGTEILKRMLADECELCGSREGVEVPHIRKLADLRQKGRKEKPYWVQIMAARRRKTLVVCRICHKAIHTGRPTRQRNSD